MLFLDQLQFIVNPLFLELELAILELKIVYVFQQLEFVRCLIAEALLYQRHPLVAIFNFELHALSHGVEVFQLVLEVLSVGLQLGNLLLFLLQLMLLSHVGQGALLHFLRLVHGNPHLVVGLLEGGSILLELVFEELDVAVFQSKLLIGGIQLGLQRSHIGSQLGIIALDLVAKFIQLMRSCFEILVRHSSYVPLLFQVQQQRLYVPLQALIFLLNHVVVQVVVDDGLADVLGLEGLDGLHLGGEGLALSVLFRCAPV